MSRTYDGEENADFLTPLLTTQVFGCRSHPSSQVERNPSQTPRNFGDSLEAATTLESDRSRAETPTRRRITTSQAAKFGREGHPVLLGSVQLFCPSALVFTKPVLPRHPIETSHSWDRSRHVLCGPFLLRTRGHISCKFLRHLHYFLLKADSRFWSMLTLLRSDMSAPFTTYVSFVHQ